MSFRIIEPILFILKIEYRLSRRWQRWEGGGDWAEGSVYSVAYEET